MMQVEVPPVSEWQRRASDREQTVAMLERIAAQGSIRRKKRESLVARARRRLGWR